MIFTDITKNKKALFLTAVGIIIGLSLLILDVFLSNEKNIPNKDSRITEDYTGTQEEQLEELLDSINGVSDAKVMITLKSGNEFVYAADSSAEDEKLVVVDNSLVCVKENYPEIEGIAVVCKGGNRDDIKKQITELICSLFGIPSNHVYVTE